jgi:hypothetical protein
MGPKMVGISNIMAVSRGLYIYIIYLMYFQKLPLFYGNIWEYMGYTLLSLLLNCNLIGNNNDKPSKNNKDNQNHKLLPKAVALFDTPKKINKIAKNALTTLHLDFNHVDPPLFVDQNAYIPHQKKVQYITYIYN